MRPRAGANAMFINFWNAPTALHNPNCNLLKANVPKKHANAVYLIESYDIRTYQYPAIKSRIAKTSATSSPKQFTMSS